MGHSPAGGNAAQGCGKYRQQGIVMKFPSVSQENLGAQHSPSLAQRTLWFVDQIADLKSWLYSKSVVLGWEPDSKYGCFGSGGAIHREPESQMTLGV